VKKTSECWIFHAYAGVISEKITGTNCRNVILMHGIYIRSLSPCVCLPHDKVPVRAMWDEINFAINSLASVISVQVQTFGTDVVGPCSFNPLKPELNPICYLLALLGAHHFLHVSRIRVKLLTFR